MSPDVRKCESRSTMPYILGTSDDIARSDLYARRETAYCGKRHSATTPILMLMPIFQRNLPQTLLACALNHCPHHHLLYISVIRATFPISRASYCTCTNGRG